MSVPGGHLAPGDGAEPPAPRDRLTKVIDTVLALALISILGLMLAEIFARNVLGTSTMVADEYSTYGLVVVGSLGLGRTLATGTHVRVGALLAALAHRPGARKTLEVLSSIALLIFALICASQMGLLALENWQGNVAAPTIIRTPIYLPQVIAVAGFVLLGVAAVVHLVRTLRRADLTPATDLLEGGES